MALFSEPFGRPAARLIWINVLLRVNNVLRSIRSGQISRCLPMGFAGCSKFHQALHEAFEFVETLLRSEAKVFNQQRAIHAGFVIVDGGHFFTCLVASFFGSTVADEGRSILLSLNRSQVPAWDRTVPQAPPASDWEAEPLRQCVPRQEPGNKLHCWGWCPG